jgi:hypothetical protein
VFFVQSVGEKNNKQNIVTRNPGDTMGISSYGSFFCLWAVRARSARGRVLTEPWATSPTAGAMKIERGVVYNPTIHHGYLLEKNRHPGRRQPWPLPPLIGPPRLFRSRARVDRAMGNAPKSSCGGCITQQSTMAIFYKIIRHPEHRQPWSPPPPMGRPRPLRSRSCVDRAISDAPYRRRHEN